MHEIRVERRSSVLFLPQYRDPIPARYIEFIWQAVRNYPEFSGRARWVDRVFVRLESGETVACGSLWPNGGPAADPRLRGRDRISGESGMRAMLRDGHGPRGRAGARMIL